jgi:hypothetical protein
MTMKHFITTDKNLNKELANQVATLRGGIVRQSNKIKENPMFSYELSLNDPSAKITNKENGKFVIVPLFAYSEVKDALNKLF